MYWISSSAVSNNSMLKHGTRRLSAVQKTDREVNILCPSRIPVQPLNQRLQTHTHTHTQTKQQPKNVSACGPMWTSSLDEQPDHARLSHDG